MFLLTLILICCCSQYDWIWRASLNRTCPGLNSESGVTYYKDEKLLPFLEGIPYLGYHGSFLSANDEYDFEAAITWRWKYLQAYIPLNASVVDMGCGFCGLSSFLSQTRPDISVTSVTIHREGAEFCRQKGFNVIETEFSTLLNRDYFPGDIALFSESFFYIGRTLNEKVEFLKRLQSETLMGLILIHNPYAFPFCPVIWGGSGRSMSKTELLQVFSKAGWKVHSLVIQPYVSHQNYWENYHRIIRDNLNRVHERISMPKEIQLVLQAATYGSTDEGFEVFKKYIKIGLIIANKIVIESGF